MTLAATVTAVLLELVVLSTWRSAVQAVSPALQVPCTVTIDSHKKGQSVGRNEMFKGTAALPLDSYLWIVVKQRGLAGVWPQGAGEAERGEGGRWEVFIQEVGSPGDVGEFEIQAWVFTKAASDYLNAYVARNYGKEKWPPVLLTNHEPPLEVLEGCAAPVARLVVTKSRRPEL